MNGRWAIRRLALGRLLSGTGSQMAAIALSADIYSRTDSAVWLSATFFLTFGISGLLNPVAGLIADRFDRRHVMVASDVAGAIVWTILLLGNSPAWLLALGFLGSVVSQPFWIASRAAVPNLVAEDDLAWANGTIAVAGNTARVLGPVLGGAIAGLLSARYAYAANAASFIVSALLVLSVTTRFQAVREETEEPGTIWTGFRVIFADPVLRALTVVWTVLFLTIDVAIVADLLISRAFGWGIFGYGLINAFFGGGALLGAFVARKLSVRMEAPGVLAEVLGVGVGYGMVAIAPAFAVVLAGQTVASGTDAVGEVAGTNIVQRAAADSVRGRVFGAIGTLGLGANAVGFMFAGFIVQAIGPRWTYGLCALVSVAAAPLLFPLFTRKHTDVAS
jgi:MFS family permease